MSAASTRSRAAVDRPDQRPQVPRDETRPEGDRVLVVPTRGAHRAASRPRFGLQRNDGQERQQCDHRSNGRNVGSLDAERLPQLRRSECGWRARLVAVLALRIGARSIGRLRQPRAITGPSSGRLRRKPDADRIAHHSAESATIPNQRLVDLFKTVEQRHRSDGVGFPIDE